MRKRKREAVTASFHYLSRQVKNGEDLNEIPFSLEEFASLSATLIALKPVDLENEEIKDLLRYKNIAPIEAVQIVNDRMTFGLYRGAYWGHAYDNSEKGKISADSISLRPFYFLLYLSESGRIYIGTQYLGHFGSYTALKSTLVSFLPNRSNIVPHSFRLEAAVFQDVQPKEVRVQISRRSQQIDKDNVFENGAIIAFKKQSRGDGFEEQVRRKLLPFMGTSKEKVQKAVGEILKNSSLIDVNDDDILDCTIIGDVNGLRKTFYMIENGSFASQFPITVSFNSDGHPEYEPTKKAMVEILTNQIIVLKENA